MLNKIKKGEIIDVVAPSSLCSIEILEYISCILKEKGIIARINGIIKDNCHSKNNRIFDPIEAFEVFKESLLSTDSSIVWALRGGYGASRIVDYMHKLKKPKVEKTFIGYSDSTALHLFLNSKWNWNTIHGAMLASNSEIGKKFSIVNNKNTSINSVIEILNEPKYSYKLSSFAKNTASVDIQGRVVGGNISVLVSSIGTKNSPNLEDAILFLEEINEPEYKIERMLYQMLQSGILAKAIAVVFGDCISKIKNNTENNIDSSLIKDFIKRLDIPCFTIKNMGHGDINVPIVFNKIHHIKNNNLILDYE
jgi:muramoyltetrapeptide carboxypeptidase